MAGSARSSDAAALTVQAVAGVDVEAAGLLELRPARADDLARIARAAFEPRCRWPAPGAEPVAWGELTPGTEADLPRLYRYERYGSLSWALHVPARQHPRAEAIPALLHPGRHPRRVTLIEHKGPHETVRSVFVTASVSDPAEIGLAGAEVEAARALRPAAPGGVRRPAGRGVRGRPARRVVLAAPVRAPLRGLSVIGPGMQSLRPPSQLPPWLAAVLTVGGIVLVLNSLPMLAEAITPDRVRSVSVRRPVTCRRRPCR